MSKKPAKIQFNGGEISPWLEGRVDLAKYDKSSKLCRNFIPVVEGCLKRRGGTLFVAKTPDDESLRFRILPNPLDAVVKINGIEKSEIFVSRGDVVRYEVSLNGYVTLSDEIAVIENMDLKISLVSKTEMCNLTIVVEPGDATIKIEGFERSSYQGSKNSEVLYLVYKEGYETKTEKVILDEDKTINVVLDKVDNTNVAYGSWGDPIRFCGCTAVGQADKQLKCFLLQFSNGYLPIIFNANWEAPKEDFQIDETLFFSNIRDGYDAIYWKKGEYHLGVISRNSEAIFYYDLDGKLEVGYDYLSCAFFGWQIDEYSNYATKYNTYDGVVNNGVFQVYRSGKLVWELKGRYDE